MMHQPPPYTPKALAKRWGCSVSHVYDMLRRGELDYFVLGKKLYRIPAAAVEESQGSGVRVAHRPPIKSRGYRIRGRSVTGAYVPPTAANEQRYPADRFSAARPAPASAQDCAADRRPASPSAAR
ncbi:MAG: DNA-binding protein [Alphaproteobacteria bacterium]|nr:MAG: DNA-binding protein [Alphaproteobacteria bacterium]